MELVQFLRMILRRWIWVVVPPLVLALAAGIFSIAQPKVFTAKASSYFAIGGGRSASDLNQGANYTLLQLASFASLATQPIVLDDVILRLGLQTTPAELAQQLEVTTSSDTVILTIMADAGTPEDAARLANAVNTVLSEKVKLVSPKVTEGSGSTPTIQSTVVSEASPPPFPSGPQTVRNTAIAGFVGLLVGLLLALARDKLDTRVMQGDDIPAGIATLGAVTVNKYASQPNSWGGIDEARTMPQAFGRIQANLRFAGVDSPIRSLLVTSAVPGEGKSTTAVGVALAMAEAGARTLLIDADLRRPRVSNYLDLEGAVGLADVLVGTVNFHDVVQEWGTRGLLVLAAGTTPPDPKLLLDSKAMSNLLAEVQSDFDVLVIDSPPILAVVDSLTLTDKIDAVMLVVGRGRVRKKQLTDAVQSLVSAKANLVGVILNHMPIPRGQSEYGY